MRCPKCHYISFDSGERCRNCGYDFSLSSGAGDAPKFDVPIQPQGLPVGPMGDFELAGRDAAVRTAAAEGSAGAPASRPITASDLPLFTERPRPDPSPRVNPAPAPRPPLSVRKSTPLPRPARSRGPDADEPTLDLGAPGRVRGRMPGVSDSGEDEAAPEATGAAGLAARLLAGLIDTSLMVGIHAAVVYFTLRLCGLTFDDIAVVPPVPMAGFLLLLTGGYFVSFTAASGQTIGKMAAGIRVVPTADPDHSRVPLGTAMVRAAACLLSVLPAGAGLLPALFSAEHRALHDRLADTRVVKA